MKRILIINGHPNDKSYNYALADNYQKGAEEAGFRVDRLDLAALVFNPLFLGYSEPMEDEDAIKNAKQLIHDANHLVWVFPLWWSSMPALMKGFIDRVFVPDFAFKYQKGSPFPKKLLKGKTARIIMTSDSPKWYYDWVMKAPATRQLKKGTLQFCGINPVKTTYIAPIRQSTGVFREKWLIKVYELGKKGG